jgi:hypothetical protein
MTNRGVGVIKQAGSGSSAATWLGKVFRFLASLKLAVVVLLTLALALAVGTVLESLYDTPTAQYWVYRAFWFRTFLLGLLAVNIFTVALSRYPWKPKHTPFLMAHLGILLLLVGAWLTDRVGLDGTMRITEGEVSSTVEVDVPLLAVSDGNISKILSMPWIPPHIGWKPMDLVSRGLAYDIKIDHFLSHAEPEFHFLPAEKNGLSRFATAQKPAIKIKLTGGPMRITQEYWLWKDTPGWNAFQAGPAWLAFGTEEGMPSQGPRLLLTQEKDGSVSYRASSSTNEKVSGRLPAGKVAGQVIQPGWKGGVSITVMEWVPDAELEVDYKSARIQYGEMAPPPAIHLVAGKGGKGAELWLGQGDRSLLRLESGKEIMVSYYRKQVILPFSLRLDRFNIERYEGTMNPSSYASNVTVMDGRLPKDAQSSSVISMNEPLKVRDVTVYQASYEDAFPRPVTSIFSINQDPGRSLKYGGSILIVLGSILLFAMKYRLKRR